MNHPPLPRVPAPYPDELFSSWLSRIARANFCTPRELIRYLGYRQTPEKLSDLEGNDATRLLDCLRLSQKRFEEMLLIENSAFPINCVSNENFQRCPACHRARPDITLRHWRYAWSVRCHDCGSWLRPISCEMDISEKLIMRAQVGAKFLEMAYLSEDKWQARRVQTAVTFAQATLLRHRHTAVLANNRSHRYELLAVIGAAKTRPLIKAAVVLRNFWRVERHLLEAFPYRRKTITQVLSLRPYLTRRLPEQFQKQTKESSSSVVIPIREARNSYKEAARKAIEQLGETAPRKQLLKRAERIMSNDNTA